MLVARQYPELFPVLYTLRSRSMDSLKDSFVGGRCRAPNAHGIPVSPIQLNDHWQVDFASDDQTREPTMFCGEEVHGQVELIIKHF
ncbi:hypothetical protein N7453_006902 [Penicillium expansum]|nr:hypothetical protein N7453_006902 [Penicillium expansum]